MRKRGAFTLVEMLVSVALTLFIMVLLSQAFAAGLQAFRQMKALGDMEERLRSTSTILRRDLTAFHFENVRKLSDPNFWSTTYGGGPPAQGFFRIWQGVASTQEGTDGDGIQSFRATSHMLNFTCKLLGLGPDDFASAYLPPSLAAANPPITTPNLYGSNTCDTRFIAQSQAQSLYRSRWFEVAYFLRPSGLTAGSSVPLFTLYRRQLTVVNPAPPIAPTTSTSSFSWPDYYQLSCNLPNLNAGTSVTFNKPSMLTMPARRFAMATATTSPTNYLAGIPSDSVNSVITYPCLGETATLPANQVPIFWQDNTSYNGSDVLLSDVISFEISVLTADNPAHFSDLFHQTNFTGSNSAFTTSGPMVFDTWSSQNDGTYNYSGWASSGTYTSAPMQLHIQAVKIIIRVWDNKTRQARQVTVLQDM